MYADEVAAWTSHHALDGAEWTNLPCGFKNSRGVMPSVADVLAHLKRLEGETQAKAREYVEGAPAQVDTAYRRAINSELKWTSPTK